MRSSHCENEVLASFIAHTAPTLVRLGRPVKSNGKVLELRKIETPCWNWGLLGNYWFRSEARISMSCDTGHGLSAILVLHLPPCCVTRTMVSQLSWYCVYPHAVWHGPWSLSYLGIGFTPMLCDTGHGLSAILVLRFTPMLCDAGHGLSAILVLRLPPCCVTRTMVSQLSWYCVYPRAVWHGPWSLSYLGIAFTPMLNVGFIVCSWLSF